MLSSMTGFGSKVGHLDGLECTVLARSVNNRYLKTVIKLPEAWAEAESDVERLIRRQLHRGTVTVTVRIKVADERAASDVNTAALRKYVDQLRELAAEAPPTLRIDLGSLLLLPGVCEPPSLEDVVQKARGDLAALIDAALDALVDMRRREGQTIAEDLRANGDVIDAQLATVREQAPNVVRSYLERLRARVAELTNAGTVRVDEESLAREVAVFAERSDIAEEIARLRGHLAQFREVLLQGGAAGRKLDFIAQEMLREANTMASKANDADIARSVVEMKTAIDRIKEQVQNLE